MPFSGNHPFGTAGGDDELLLPQDPPDAVLQEGGSHLAYLIINGPITIRNRSAIEAIVRTLDNRGRSEGSEPIVVLVTKTGGAVIEPDTGTIDARNGIKITSVTPNVVTIELTDGGIQTAKLADALVTAAKLATDAVETAKIKNLNVTGAKLANRTITAGKIGQNQVTPYELDRTYLQSGYTRPFADTFSMQYKTSTGTSQQLRTQPDYGAYVMYSVPANTQVSLVSPGVSIMSGGDRWYQVFIPTKGIGWLPWDGMTAI